MRTSQRGFSGTLIEVRGQNQISIRKLTRSQYTNVCSFMSCYEIRNSIFDFEKGGHWTPVFAVRTVGTCGGWSYRLFLRRPGLRERRAPAFRDEQCGLVWRSRELLYT